MSGPKKLTMTLNLSDREMAALEALAHGKDLSKTAILRRALRLLGTVEARLAAGDKLVFEGEGGRRRELVVV